jgi:serine/threonine protein kinase
MNNSTNSNKLGELSEVETDNINNCKIVQFLGRGASAAVHKITINISGFICTFAKKTQKVHTECVKFNGNCLVKDLFFNVWREIYLLEWLHALDKNDQEFFAELFYWELKQCDPSLQVDNRIQKKSFYESARDSPYVLEIIMDIKDGSLYDLLLNETPLTKKNYISIYIQTYYPLYLLHTNGFTHNDIKRDNLLYKKTDPHHVFNLHVKTDGKNKTIYKVPSYGYTISLIDYAFVNHEQFRQNERDSNDNFPCEPHVYDLLGVLIDVICGFVSHNTTKQNMKQKPCMTGPVFIAMKKYFDNNPDLYNKIKNSVKKLYEAPPHNKVYNNEKTFFEIIEDQKLFASIEYDLSLNGSNRSGFGSRFGQNFSPRSTSRFVPRSNENNYRGNPHTTYKNSNANPELELKLETIYKIGRTVSAKLFYLIWNVYDRFSACSIYGFDENNLMISSETLYELISITMSKDTIDQKYGKIFNTLCGYL